MKMFSKSFGTSPAGYTIIIQLLLLAIVAVGQECADNVGFLEDGYNDLHVPNDLTFVLADPEYRVPCEGTVIAWQFCYRLLPEAPLRPVTFFPSIWMINDTNDDETIHYTLIQSRNITFIPTDVHNDTDNILCPRVNLSVADQFTAPAGSVVGLYSYNRRDEPRILRTDRNKSFITTYEFRGNLTSVQVINATDANYKIALRVHIVPTTSATATTTITPLPTTTPTSSHDRNSSIDTTTITTPSVPSTSQPNSDDKFRVIWIIGGCIVGGLLCIIHLSLIILLLWCRRKRRGKRSGSLEDARSTTGCILESTGTNTDRYSTVLNGESQAYSLPLSRQNNFSEYTIPFSTDCHKNYKPQKGKKHRVVGNTSVAPAPLPAPYLTPQNAGENNNHKDYSKFANNDYEPIPNPSECASALKIYSNSLKRTVVYNNTNAVQYSKILNQNASRSTTDEEIYSDPGHCERDIYDYFKKKKFHTIKKDSVSISQQLGYGEFGVVSLGKWSKTSTDCVQVAVKTLNSQCSESEKVKFLREAAIMGQFEDNHIVKLHGVVTELQNTMIILEYMPKGDLQELLITFKEMASSEAELKHDLLSFCRQIAAGMNYLANKQFVHRDLAARNILVSSDDVCKIADFGMARDVSDDTYYIIAGGKIPIKWTAPEAIFYRKYSVQSDVWSFGCVMYEIWSLGHRPFEDVDGREYLNKISLGQRLSPPPGCSRAIYELMIQCWHPVANQRINSRDVLRTLGKSDRILLPSGKDNEEQSTKLGDPLSTSSELYLDLQKSYFLTS